MFHDGATYVAVAPDDPNTFYVTIFRYPPFPTFPPIFYSAMYRTRDAGQNWVALPIDQRAWVTEPVIGTQGRLYILQDGNLWRSTDYGDSWTKTAELGEHEWRIVASPSNPSVLYGFIYQRSAVWQSRDFGETWAQVAEFPYSNWVSSLAVDPLDSDRVYVAAGSLFMLTPSRKTVRALADGGLPEEAQIAVMLGRRVLLVAPGWRYQGLYATGIPPIRNRSRPRR